MDEDTEPELDRRTLFRLAAGAATSGLAGCSFEVDDDGVEVDVGDGATPTTSFGYGGSPTATPTSVAVTTAATTAAATTATNDDEPGGDTPTDDGGTPPPTPTTTAGDTATPTPTDRPETDTATPRPTDTPTPEDEYGEQRYGRLGYGDVDP